MTAPEQVQVTKADRDAYDCLMYDENYDHPPHGAWHFARHRHTATADALSAMREALEAPMIDHSDRKRGVYDILRAAIAKIEGDTK